MPLLVNENSPAASLLGLKTDAVTDDIELLDVTDALTVKLTCGDAEVVLTVSGVMVKFDIDGAE